jgi:3-oxoacyl-[acyl-carrier protein] reductase
LNAQSRKNKAILITGSARGLGKAMALALARAGYGVAAIDLPSSAMEMDELRKIAEAEGFSDLILPLEGDITHEYECHNLVKSAAEYFGRIHGLINNAARGMQDISAVLVGQRKKFYEVTPTDWVGVLNTNVNGPFLMARAITPYLLTQGWGRIVNIVTSFNTMQAVGFSPYGPSKAALEAAHSIWSKDLAETGVTVNALLPGRAANTRMIPSKEITDRATLVQPEEMGPPVIWLMSEASNNITGKRFIAHKWEPPKSSELNYQSLASAGFQV